MVAVSTVTAMSNGLETTTTGKIAYCFTVMVHTDTGIRQGIPVGIRITTATRHIHRVTTTHIRHGAIHRMALEYTAPMAIETLSLRGGSSRRSRQSFVLVCVPEVVVCEAVLRAPGISLVRDRRVRIDECMNCRLWGF